MRPLLPGREIALGKFTKYFNSRLRDDQFEPTVLQVDEHTSVSRPSRDRALLEQLLLRSASRNYAHPVPTFLLAQVGHSKLCISSAHFRAMRS